MRKNILTTEQFLSCMVTGACVELLLALFGVRLVVDGEHATASVAGIIVGAILTIATTVYSAVSESVAADEAEGEARELEKLSKRDRLRRERLEARAGRQKLALERDRLEENKRIQRENEKARREERRRAKQSRALQHQQNIAGIAVPDQTGQEEAIKQEKQQMWGV